MAEQKAGLDRELWARIGEIADAYSKKEMAADIAAASAWVADRKRIEALERVRLAAQAVANTWRIAEGSPCVTENEAEDALVAALRSEEEKP